MMLTIYPAKHYKPIMEEIGLLLTFLNKGDDTPLREQMEAGYGMPVSEIEGGTVSAEGVFQFPGDPPLHPLASISRGEEKVWIYPYGIVAFRPPVFVTRMD